MEPKLAVDPQSPILVNSNLSYNYDLGMANINIDALEINIDLGGADPFLSFDKDTLTFSMKEGNGAEGIYRVNLELIYESDLG